LIGAEDDPSIITFGGYNPNYTVDEIQWHQLKTNDHWTINLDEVFIDDLDFNVSTHDLVIDTGTSLLLFPDRDFFRFIDILTAKNFSCESAMYYLYACDCDSLEKFFTLPDINMMVDGHEYKIGPEHYTYYVPEENLILLKIMHMELPKYASFWIMGMNFFNKYYTIFDVDNKRIGLGESIFSANIDGIYSEQMWLKEAVASHSEKRGLIN
jgi:hypothetical protein